MNTTIIDHPETTRHPSGHFPGLPGHRRGRGAAGFPFLPTHEELPLHMRFSNLNLDQHNMHDHARGPGGQGFPMPSPLPQRHPPPIALFGLHAFGHSWGVSMPLPGLPPFQFPPPPELGAYGYSTPFHPHVPGPPFPARSDRGRFRPFGAHVRFASRTVPPTEATTTATATTTVDTPDTTTTEAQAAAASTAPPPAVRGDTVPDPALPRTRHHRHHHHLHGPHYFSGLHTHHGHVHGGSRIPLVNMRRALRFSQRRGHGGYGRGLGFGRGRSFGHPYVGHPNPYYSFGWQALDDTEGGSDQGEEEKRREETMTKIKKSTISDNEILETPENGNEGSTGTRATRTRNNDNHPATEEEDYISRRPDFVTSPIQLLYSVVGQDLMLILNITALITVPIVIIIITTVLITDLLISDPGIILIGLELEAALAGGGPGLGRGFHRGGHIHSHIHLHPRPHPYFHDHPPHPPPYYNGPDFDNDTHPDFDRHLGFGIPPLRSFPPPFSPSPTVDTNGLDVEEGLDFGPGFSFGSTRGRGGRGEGGGRGLGLGRQGR
ncbi:hypothetical protein K435DRAFT_852355 [Dendrothele bispora CBS 962.96]|uniref:Uncharacterized protein n=1 Tax=Dendrothele bispora (strain CBS 962.96) TaxID=1314807 RepID=A0A4S8MJH1_DENBC|nr:hypothetical protein K435DRAFT_852355 [Dendrothele bispora CBS 962.96]